MSWKGKETKTWFCHKCNQYSPYGFPDCVFCVHQGNKGKAAKGKSKGMLMDTNKSAKGKGFTPSTSPLRGIYQQYQAEPKKTESTSPQKDKMRRLKKALSSLQGMDGMEERVERLKTDIKEQQTHVNTEQGVDKIEQTAKLLTELKASGKKFREASDFHHTEAVKNSRSHQEMEDDIGKLYEELASLGWVPTDTESEEGQDPEMNSLDYWKDPKLMQTGGTETASQARARHARSRAEQSSSGRSYCLKSERQESCASKTYKAWRAWKQKKNREGMPALASAVEAEGLFR
jgi:hypothetical protein